MQEPRRQRLLVGVLIAAGVIAADEVIAIKEVLGLSIGFDGKLQGPAHSQLPGDTVGEARLPGTGFPGEQQGHPQGGGHIYCRGEVRGSEITDGVCDGLFVDLREIPPGTFRLLPAFALIADKFSRGIGHGWFFKIGL